MNGNSSLSQGQRKAYEFLKDRERTHQQFTVEEFRVATGWKLSTCKTHYLRKKLRSLVNRSEDMWTVSGVLDLDEDTFGRICSQVSAYTEDPSRPRLTPNIEILVRKARDTALSAITIFNNPTISFRAGNFLILMIVAWTSLMLAKLMKENKEVRAVDNNGNPYEDHRKGWKKDLVRAISMCPDIPLCQY